jgi:DivIVA domain-containing protein
VSLALLLLAVALTGVVAAVATGSVCGGLPEPVRTGAGRPLPVGPLRPRDLEDLRLSVVVRGYRMDEVDAVLDRLRDELAARDERIVALEQAAEQAAVPAAAPGGVPGPDGRG